jgi:L-lactate dehydrogenase complex protein LldG
MNSREKILAAIQQNKPSGVALPDLVFRPYASEPEGERFAAVLSSIGGTCIFVDGIDGIVDHLSSEEKGNRTVNAVPEMPGFNAKDFSKCSAAELEGVHTFMAKSSLGVAENGAVWLAEENIYNRLLPFICQHLILLVNEKDLVATMHDAYRRIEVQNTGYGVFLAGPSKTADIEQALVVGAHGSLSLRVFVIRA